MPLTTFRAAALKVALGLLLDAFLVRQILVPVLTVLVGRISGWPSRWLGKRPEGRKETRRAERVEGYSAPAQKHMFLYASLTVTMQKACTLGHVVH